MPILPSSYSTPFWLRNPHISTIWPVLFRRMNFPRGENLPPCKRVRLDTEDGDFLDMDVYPPSPCVPNRGTAILSHGLEGNSRRKYILGLARLLLRAGFHVLAWTMRGCSGEPNRTERMYHMGVTEDLAAVIRHAESLDKPILLAGFSMGGNQTCMYLAKGPVSPLVRAAIAISVPCDLEGAARVMDSPSCAFYMHYFLRTMLPKMKEKAARFPNFPSVEGIDRFRTFMEFDSRFTAPIYGYASAREYWKDNSILPWLPHISIPVYMLLAQDDPFCSPSCYPREAALANPYLHLEITPHGGHVGFAQSGQVFYSEERALEFVRNFWNF